MAESGVEGSPRVLVPKPGSPRVARAGPAYALPAGVDVLILEAGTAGVGNSDAAGDALYAANPSQAATLTGNSPNDTFVIYDSADVVVPKAGSHDVVYSAVSYTLPTGVDVLILEGTATSATGNTDTAGDTPYATSPTPATTLTPPSHNTTLFVYHSPAPLI